MADPTKWPPSRPTFPTDIPDRHSRPTFPTFPTYPTRLANQHTRAAAADTPTLADYDTVNDQTSRLCSVVKF